jgi:hypothetical protein
MKTKSLDLVPSSSILPFMAMAMHREVQHSLITEQSDNLMENWIGMWNIIINSR